MAHTAIYNSYTIPNRVGAIAVNTTPDRATVSIDFVLTAADADALTVADGLMRASLLVPYQDLEVDFGDTNPDDNWLRLGQTASTGMNAMPRLSKVGDPERDGGEVSRQYTWTCEFELPGHQTGYRRSGSVREIIDADKRRTLVFTAVYTGGGGNDARTNALTNGDTWAAARLAAIDSSGVYDKAAPDTITFDQTTKVATWSRTYRQQTEQDDAAGQVDAVINAVLDYRVDVPQRWGLPLATPQGQTQVANPNRRRAVGYTNRVTCNYRATIDHTLITSETWVEEQWASKLRPWLLERVSQVLNLGAYQETSGPLYAEHESFAFSRSTNQLTASLVLMAPSSRNAVISYSEKVKSSRAEGKVHRKLWDGRANTYARWQVGAEETLTHIVAVKQLNAKPTAPPLYGAQWDLLHEDDDYYAEVSGDPAQTRGSLQANIEHTVTWVRQYRRVAAASYDVGADPRPVTTGSYSGSQAIGRSEPTLFRVDGGGNVAIVQGRG